MASGYTGSAFFLVGGGERLSNKCWFHTGLTSVSWDTSMSESLYIIPFGIACCYQWSLGVWLYHLARHIVFDMLFTRF